MLQIDLHRFDLNLLVTLDALLSEKNVTRAGVRMNLSQSAMSGALARLRDFFQDELLVQVGRRRVLTPLAEGLVQPVRDVLLQVQAAIATTPRFDPVRSSRHFSIAVSDYVTSVLLVDFLREVKRQSPGITFELRPVGKRATEDLESGELDFLIAPEPFVSAVHPKEVLFQDTHTCVAWKKNRHLGATNNWLRAQLKQSMAVAFGRRRPAAAHRRRGGRSRRTAHPWASTGAASRTALLPRRSRQSARYPPRIAAAA